MLKIRAECDTYLTHVCRHYSSGDSLEKRCDIKSFQPTLWLSSVIDVDWSVYGYSWWKPQCWLKTPYITSFLRAITATVMSTDVSQVGVALFRYFKIYHFTFPGFHFIITYSNEKVINVNKGKGQSKNIILTVHFKWDVFFFFLYRNTKLFSVFL